MGKLIRQRLAAFSLPETIVALVIILTVVGIATVIITGTGRNRLTIQELRATEVLRGYADSTRALKLWTSDSAVAGEFIVRRQVSPWQGYDSLLRIHYYIYDVNRKLLADWQSLVRADE
jgi:type II secretory pathway pseudopilin PulG